MNRVTDLDTQPSKEIDLFTSGSGRGEYLRAASCYLETILPTSVDCERFVFQWHHMLTTKFVQMTC